MLRFTIGNMFETDADIRVNTVNCVGVMGAGVALAFKQRYPEMYRDYKRECDFGNVKPGKLHVWRNLSGDWIINFPTKRHWREKSRYEDIDAGLVALREYLEEQGSVRVTLPALGSGHGRLDWAQVKKMIQRHLEGLEAEVIVFDPADSRSFDNLQPPVMGQEIQALNNMEQDFPKDLAVIDCEKVYYQGDLAVLNNIHLTIALSPKPEEAEENAALESLYELPKELTVCLTLGSASASRLAQATLDRGNLVAAWVAQGLSHYQLSRALRGRDHNLLLLSLAKPQQAWNPHLADRTRLACVLTSKVTLISDPQARWLSHLDKVIPENGRTFFYIHYKDSNLAVERNLKSSLRAIGRKSSDGKPNLSPILDELRIHIDSAPEPTGKDVESLPQAQDTSSQPEWQEQVRTAIQYPKRLIEVDLPIKRISAHARREKSIRHGHISTLHIWWARRPLAACRAVICAALWPDPADPLCPEPFRETARTLMRDWAQNHKEFLGEESFARFVTFQRNPSELENNETLRAALLDFIADFANWDNSNVREYLDTSRALTQSAHEVLGGAPGTRPLVVDPFAGGGSIPLEALRIGADVFASDLNPVSVLLNKVVLEYIPQYGQRLADEVRKWGGWVKREAEKELAEFYPKDPDGATPIAYLWSRTIQCEGPSCGSEVPLIRSLWLAKKANRSVALQLAPNGISKRVDFQTIVKNRDGWVDHADPKIKVENPKFEGTVKRGSATCQFCGYTTPVASVRQQLKARRGGASDARMLCVVSMKEGGGRFFRVATDSDLRAVDMAKAELNRQLEQKTRDFIPDEEFTGTEPRRIPLPQYGIKGFRDIFAPRQLLVLSTLAHWASRVSDQLPEGPFSGAIQACVALAVSRHSDMNASLAMWHTTRELVTHVFGRQAMPMVWDFAEPNPFAAASGSFLGGVDWIARVLAQPVGHSGEVALASATDHPLPNNSVAAVVTDPPYYYSVPYSDLSDYFYVWLKRILNRSLPQLFGQSLTPKEKECVQNLPHSEVAHRQKSRAFYEQTMEKSLSEARRITSANGIGVVVFAHSATEAWESLLTALINAGWCVTGSWPIDTEMANRVLAQRQSTLASSVHLVCRPRQNSDDLIDTNEVGDWRDVLQELPSRIHEWMPRLAEEGVVGADAIFACIGPALEIFSRYSRVEKASGQTVKLKEYLELIWAAVAKEALTIIFPDADTVGFEEDARLTAMWLWTLSAGNSATNGEGNGEKEGDDESEASGKKAKPGGFVLEYDAARKIAQGLGAHLETLVSSVEIRGETARLLPVSERAQFLFGKQEEQQSTGQRRKKKLQIDLFDVGKTEDLEDGGLRGDFTLKTGETVLDRLHQSMILFGAGRPEALKRFLVEDGAGRDQRLWRLAQALAALYPTGTDERRWVEGVLARKRSLGF